MRAACPKYHTEYTEHAELLEVGIPRVDPDSCGADLSMVEFRTGMEEHEGRERNHL